jgi:hypothetical protein
MLTNDWKAAARTYFTQEFINLPPLTVDYAKSFLIQGTNKEIQ